MKSKSVFRLVRTGSRLLAIALVTLLAAQSSQAATLYWDGTGNLTSGWSDEANWDTAVDGTGGNPSLLIPVITDIASFSINTILSTAQNVNLFGNQAAYGLHFLGTNTAATNLLGGDADHTLTLDVGGITVDSLAGAVTIGSATLGQKVAIALAGPQAWTNNSSSALTIENAVANGGNLLTIGGSGNTTINGVLSGTGGLTKADGGTLTISAAPTYTGGTTVTGGNLYLRTDLFTSNGTLGTLFNIGNVTVNTGATFRGERGYFAGTLTMDGGTWSANNGFGDGWTGSIVLTSTSTFNSTLAQTVVGNITGAGGLTKTGGSTLTLNGAGTYLGTTTISAGTLQLGSVFKNGTISGAITNNTTLTFGNAGAQTHSGAISGPGVVNVSGAGTLTMSVANNYTGLTSVNAGVLSLNDAAALPGGIDTTVGAGESALTLNGGVIGLTTTSGDFLRDVGTGVGQVQWTAAGGFTAYGGDRAVNLGGASAGLTWAGSFGSSGLILSSYDSDSKVTFQNPIDLNGSVRTITVANGSAAVDAELSGLLSGAAGGINKAGVGTLLLSAANTYGGATTIGQGILLLGAAGDGTNTPLGLVGGNTTVSATGGALDLGGITLSTAEPLTLNGSGLSNAGALTNSGAAAAYSGAITLASAASIGSTNGTLTLTGGVAPFSTTLTTALTNGQTGITSLAVAALPFAIPSGSMITIGTGGTTQNVVLSSGASAGATSLAVTSFTSNAAYAIGTATTPNIGLTFSGSGNTTVLTTALNASVTPITKIGSGTLTFDVNSSSVNAPISVNNGTFTLSGAGILGNVSGTISVTTSQANRTDDTLTSSLLPAGFQVGSFVLGQMVERIAGTSFNLSGAGSSTFGSATMVPYTSGVQALGGAALVIDNSGANVNNRFGGRAVGLGSSASLTLTPSTSGAVTESLSALVLMMGQSTVTLNADPGFQTNVTAGLLNSRFVGNTALIRGSNFGSAAGNGVSTLTLTAAPTFIGATGAAGATDKGILPWVIVDSTPTGYGTRFATTSGAAQVLRPLAAGEMDSTAAPASGKNVLQAGSLATITANATYNSLTIDSGNVTMTNPAFPAAVPVLTITSGGLLSTTAASNITGGVLSWSNGQLDVFTPGASAGANILTVSSRVSGQGLVKAGAGTLVLSSTSPAFSTFSQNTISGGLGVHNGSVYINEGVVQLNAHNAIGSGAVTGGTNNGNLLNVAYGGTLDLNGKTQFTGPVTSQLFLQNTGENLLDVKGGIITSATTASLVAYVGNPGGGNPGPFSFGGSITGSVGFALGSEGTWGQAFTGANSYSGPTLVYGGASGATGASGLTLKDGGTLSGTSRVDINYQGSLLLDNTGLANNTDRVNNAADIGMNGGTLTFFGRAQTISTETLGAVTAAQGNSTITVTPTNTGVNAAELTLTSLSRTAGATLNFSTGGGTLGQTGFANNPRVFITNALAGNVAPIGLADNQIIPGVVVGGDLASYNATTGIGALGQAAFPTYNSATSFSFLAPVSYANYNGNGQVISGGQTINALKPNGAITFVNNGDILTLTSGMVASAGQAYGTTSIRGGLTSSTNELILHTNGGNMTLNSVVSGANKLVLAGGGTYTLTANNLQTGGTTVNGGTLALTNSGLATPQVVPVPNATVAADGLVLNGAIATLTNSPGQIGSGNIVTLNGNSTLNLFGNNTLAGLVLNHIGQTAPVVNTTPSAFGATTASTGITLTLTGGITSTTNNIRGVAQINGRVSLPSSSTLDIGAATFNGLVINPIQADLIVTGLTGGGGTITKSGTGTLQFNQPNTLTGTLDVTVGGIQVGNVANAGARFANVVLQNGTWLNLAGQDGLFGSLATPAAGTGIVTNSGALKTLTVGFSDVSTPFAGSFQRFNDGTINLINLQKIGAGTMTMTGNTSTASGTMTINSTGGGGVSFFDNGVNNFVQNAITVNAGGTLTLNDTGSANLTNRLGNVGVTLSGGSFVSSANALGSAEATTGALTLNTGESTVTLNQGAASNVTTFANLNFGAGGTGTFGGAGIGTAVNKVVFTSAPGLTGNILPRLSVGTEFATYNQDGLGLANTDGLQAISAAASSSPADINTALFSANLKVTPAVTTRDLSAARTVNSLNISDNGVNIGTNGALLPTQGLLISTGGVIVNGTGAVISTPVTTLNAEGIFRVNGGQDLTVNSRIGGNVPLTKTGSGQMTISKLADYIGTTTVNQGTLKFGTGVGSNPLQVSVTTGAPTVQTLQMNGGTLDLNGNKLLVGTINGSNIYTGGTITNTAGGSAVTLTSLSGGGTFGGQITGNLNFTLAGNSDFRGAVTTLKDAQSYSGATVIRSGGLTLQDKGALYAGVGDLTNASVTLNNAMLVFDNANLSTTAAGPTRIPSAVPITLKAGTIAVKPGASADTITSLGTVTVGGYYNNILSNLTVNQGGVSLSNTLGGTNTLTIGNLTTSNTGGIVSFGKYSNQNGGLVDSQAQRVFVTQVNGNTVTAGSGWSNGATGMLPAWAVIAANAAGTGNATGLGDFATLSSTGFGIVAYGDTNFGAPAYLAGTTAGANFSTGSVTSIGAGTMAAGNYLTGALKATGGLSFTAATDTMNIESGGLSAGGIIGSAQNNGQLTAGGLLPTTGSTVDLYVYNSGTLNSKVIDNPNNGGAKVRLIIANVNNTTAINGNNTHTGGTVIMNGREGQYAATLGSGGVIIPAGGLTLVSNLNNSNPARNLTAPTGSIDASNDVTLAGGNVQLTMTGTNTLASLIFDDGGEGVANAVVNTAANLILSKTTAQGSAITSNNDNIGGGIPTVAGTLLTLQDGATITTSGEAPVSLSITAALTTTAATAPLHKAGSGSLIITGTNTYANGWNLDAGTIILSSTANAGIGTGTLTIADGTAIMGAAAISIGNVVNVANNASFTFGTLDATNARANATNNLTLTNTVTLGSGAHAINVNGLLMTGTISGKLTGGTDLTKGGPGTLVLNNATNDFGGTVSINGGTLRDGVAGAIPTGRIMNVAAAAAFDMNAIAQSIDSLNGAGSVINPGGAAVLTITGSTNGSFSGTLAATTAANLSLVKNGGNTQVLSGTNTYTGTSTVSGGTLQFAKTASLYNSTPANWTSTNIAVASGATVAFNVGGTGEFSTGNVTTLLTNLDGAVTTGGLLAGSTLALDTTNATGNFTVADVIADTTDTGGGMVGLTKLGGGTLELTNTNTYTGATNVNAGTLLVNGANTGNGAVTVASGATLGGYGSIAGTTTIQTGGNLAPGASAGTLSFSNGLTLADGSIFNWEHNAGNTLGTAGTNWDVANVIGGSTTISSTANIGAKLKLMFTDTLTNFADTFWNTSRTWKFITGGVSATDLFDISNIAVFINSVQQGSTNIITGEGAFSTAVSGSDLDLVWTTSGGGTNYDLWTASKGLTGLPGTATDPAFDADPDHDGIKNGLEWVLGGNPTQNDATNIQPTVSVSGGSLIQTFKREETSISETALVIEYGSNLVAWPKSVTIGAASAPADINGVVVTINTVATPDTVSVNIPTAGNAVGGKLFARMKVTRVP